MTSTRPGPLNPANAPRRMSGLPAQDSCGSCGGDASGTNFRKPTASIVATTRRAACREQLTRWAASRPVTRHASQRRPTASRSANRCARQAFQRWPPAAAWRPRTAAECAGRPTCPAYFGSLKTKYKDVDACCPGPDFTEPYGKCRTVATSASPNSTQNRALLAQLGMTAADLGIAVPCVPNLPAACAAAAPGLWRLPDAPGKHMPRELPRRPRMCSLHLGSKPPNT